MILTISIIFIVSYIFLILEHPLKINKAAFALIGGVICWTVYFIMADAGKHPNEELLHHLGEISGILFFLLGAMTIVETIDAHDGFEVITKRITTKNIVFLLWIIGLLAFFLSAILDNLTTTIVMVSLLRKIISDKKIRFTFIGIIIIAANAGGAWSPIGDVTTTMLWIGGQITSFEVTKETILPSLACLVIPLLIITPKFWGKVLENNSTDASQLKLKTSAFEQHLVFFLGIGLLIFVPVFKTVTHLPPFMGILLGLGILWVITETRNWKKDKDVQTRLSVNHALQRIDVPSILFFLGILTSISALQSIGALSQVANWLTENIKDISLINMSLGLLSSIVDNVPLVAAAMGMYDLATFPTDHHFWIFMAYCTGTGGSVLIIGSAAGVAAMGMEKIDFFWYLRNIGWLALIGYFSGAFTYLVLQGMIF